MSEHRTDATPDPSEAEQELAGRLFGFARQGSADLLAYVDAGVPVNLRNGSGDSLLMLAAYHGQRALVEGLLERGADPDLLNDRGQSPLAGAIFKSEEDIAVALRRAGADPDAGHPSARATAELFGAPLPE